MEKWNGLYKMKSHSFFIDLLDIGRGSIICFIQDQLKENSIPTREAEAGERKR